MKLRVEFRLKPTFFGGDTAKLAKEAESMAAVVWQPEFTERFIRTLDAVSKRTDAIDFSRFGWLKSADVTIINSMAVPLASKSKGEPLPDKSASKTDVISPANTSSSSSSFMTAWLYAALIISIAILGCVLYFHIRLRKAHDEIAHLHSMPIGKADYHRVRSTETEANQDEEDIQDQLIQQQRGKQQRPKKLSSALRTSVSESIQSITSILQTATNPRALDSSNPHRNYNPRYRYEPVSETNASVTHAQEDDSGDEEEGGGTERETNNDMMARVRQVVDDGLEYAEATPPASPYVSQTRKTTREVIV